MLTVFSVFEGAIYNILSVVWDLIRSLASIWIIISLVVSEFYIVT